jgi:hypothetical protein
MVRRESIQKIFRMILIDYNFELPITWVWIGVNGAFLTGRIERSRWSEELGSVVLSGNPKKIRFPVNAMLVDAKGQAAHVLFKETGEVDGVNRLRVDEPKPAVPPSPPTGWGKA